MEKISLAVQTLYAELLEQCRSVSGPSGSLYERSIKGVAYAYLKTQVGEKRLDTYLGKLTEESTIAAMRGIEDANQSLRGRRQLVQMLKQNLPSPKAALASVIDVLNWGGVMADAIVVGTNAYGCYPALVGYRLNAASLGTEDVDIATLNLAVRPLREGQNFEQLLQLADATFRAVPALSKTPFPSSFRAANGFRVDLLTQQRSSRSEMSVPLPNLQAGATPLQHLAWLIDEPANAVLLSGAGLPVKVPQPARYAVHKLIVAQKRNPAERLKRRKDLVQARSLVEVLSKSDPGALLDAYESACAQGKVGWKKPVDMSLRELGLSIG
jgi:hypothetical protein